MPAAKAGFFFWDTDQATPLAAVLAQKYEDSAMTVLPNSAEVKGEATKLYGSDSKPMAARYYAQYAIQQGTQNGDPSEYVPKFVKEMREFLSQLKASTKLSTKYGIHATP